MDVGMIEIKTLIVKGERHRPLDAGHVKELAKSIAEVGLMNPITVNEEDGTLVLIAGLHRLRACESLGYTEIAAHVLDLDALGVELAEIDENLLHHELTALERSQHLARRKELWEQMYPETKKGGDMSGRAKRDASRLAPETEERSFSEDASEKTGRSQRAIQEDLQVAKKLAPDVAESIGGTKLADSKRQLTALSRMDHEEQRVAVERWRETGSVLAPEPDVEAAEESEGPPLDANGVPLPADLIHAWAYLSEQAPQLEAEIRAVRDTWDAMQKRLHELTVSAKGRILVPRSIGTQLLELNRRLLKGLDHVRRLKPAFVCTACEGAGCRTCCQTGWLSKADEKAVRKAEEKADAATLGH